MKSREKRRVGLGVFLLGAVLGLHQPAAAQQEDGFEQEYRAWLQHREEQLQALQSPLNLIGILYLHAGENTFGSAESNALVFPAGKYPAQGGKLVYADGRVSVVPDGETPVVINGKTVTAPQVVYPAASAQLFEYGTLRWFVADVAGRLAVRLLDTESPYRRQYHGVDRFPADPAWRFEAWFEPDQPDALIPITTVFGTTNDRSSAGSVIFEYQGQTYRLKALDAGNNLFITFSDQTADAESYAFRFLTIPKPKTGDAVVLDFNWVTNPNCAFSPHAPCPLPPPENNLPFPVYAGEKKYSVAN